MSARLPEYVEPLSLCDRGEQLHGSIPLAGMTRLAGLLSSNEGEAEVELKFDLDLNGIRYLSGSVKCALIQQCQRCMEPVTKEIEVDFKLSFVDSEAAAERLPGEFEPYVMDDGPTVILRDMVEDELILALPIVATHDEACAAGTHSGADDEGSESAPKRENPFAVLQGIKKRSDSTR